MGNLTQALLLGLIVTVIIVLLLREVNAWYWKINQMISLMEEQNNLLKKLTQIQSLNLVESNTNSTTNTTEIINKINQITEPEKNEQNNKINELHNLIEEEKKGGMFSSKQSKIQELIYEIATNKEASIDLIKKYKATFNKDLFTELKGISKSTSNYEGYLYSFIKHGIVQNKEPFDLMENI